jgi:predicted RNA-binding Zn-ribbon protein involved in translation (DUF1610 family)
MTNKKWTPEWVKIRTTYLIPICCNKQMLRYARGEGRKRYYRCPECGCTALGSITREKL